MHLGCVDGSSHVDPVEQLIAHLLGPLIHAQGEVLDTHLDFGGELLGSALKPKVVFAECISELGRISLVDLPLVIVASS